MEGRSSMVGHDLEHLEIKELYFFNGAHFNLEGLVWSIKLVAWKWYLEGYISHS